MKGGDPDRNDVPAAPSFDPRTWGAAREAAGHPLPRARAGYVGFGRFAIIAIATGAIVFAAAWFMWPYTVHHASPAKAIGMQRATPQPGMQATSAIATHRIRILRCEMNEQSFYTSAVAAGIDDRLIPDIAAAFIFDFDFVREIHPGDVFEAAVDESLDTSGHAVGRPQLLYVSLVTTIKSKALYRFQLSHGEQPDWYDGDGRSTRRGLMRTPVDGARVTSTFGMREHPVLGYTRMHKGVDFGTPVGTPVYASGDGVVDAIGPHSGYGNYLRIAHSATLATAYGHLSGYPAGMAIGMHVHQGQVVAFSGNTGISTGPHLHYEILVDGQQIDPLQYKVDAGVTLAGSALVAFRRERDRVDALRAQAM